jgi:hypothetical protein
VVEYRQQFVGFLRRKRRDDAGDAKVAKPP